MPLAGHLRELRRRLLFGLAAVVPASAVGWELYPRIFRSVTEPLRRVAAERGDLVAGVNFGGLTQPFSLRLTVALAVGIVLASPVWLWQLWAFVVPGLHRREKRAAVAFVAAAVPLFLGGTLLGAWVMPRTVELLYGMTPEGGVNLPDAGQYVRFVVQLLLAFGLAFLLPVLLVMLNAARVLSARAMLRGARVAIVGICLFAAVATPDPSAWSMFVLAVPMVALYFLAVGVAALVDRRRRASAPTWLATPDDTASELT